MIDRRKFLERSVLSAGSVLFSSVLLESCTKYGIPLPGGNPHPGGNTPPPPPPPLLGSDDSNWTDADSEITITGALAMIPGVGGILSPLMQLLWPSPQVDVWGQIKDQVEALVDQKIDDTVYQQVSNALGTMEPIPDGLIGAMTLYVNAANDKGPDILSQWDSTRTVFVNALKYFQWPGYELPLLGLFGQFANLYLGLLRDGVIFGKSWGMNDAEHNTLITDLKSAIGAFTQYVTDTYNNQKDILLQSTPVNYHACEPWKTVNTLDRMMGLMVLNSWDTWPYFDATLYSEGKSLTDGTPINIPPREIYSDPYGSADDTHLPIIPTPPTQFPTNVTVWGFDRIDAVQLTYPPNSGPGGVTTTPRMGDQPNGGSGGSNQRPYGGSFNLTPANPIDKVRVSAGDIVNAMAFGWHDGTWVPWMGGLAGLAWQSNWIQYPKRAVSSIHINGVSIYYGSADLILFGFMNWQPPAEAMNVIGVLYVTTPKEHSIADFAKAFPKLAIPANLITDDLKAARKAYWNKIKARAEAIK